MKTEGTHVLDELPRRFFIRQEQKPFSTFTPFECKCRREVFLGNLGRRNGFLDIRLAHPGAITWGTITPEAPRYRPGVAPVLLHPDYAAHDS